MPKVSKRGQKRQNSKPEVKYLRTYIYVRLSEKDGGHGRRDSIYIQKQICEDYAKKHPEMLVVKVYADNGVTGTTFQRDAFEELMEDVANKKVDCIIVKDFARFGRDALDAVDLIDVIFSGGLERNKNKKAMLYCGVSDAEGHRIEIDDPFE